MTENNNAIKWDFETVNASDYLLTFDMIANKSMFDMILNKAIVKLKKKGKNIKTEAVEGFLIEERYYNLLHTILTKQIKIVAKDIRKDGVIMLTSRVEYGKFTKAGEGWNIKIKVGGIYGRKR